MKIEFTLSNKEIEFKKINLEINNYGIYMIKGPNGVGKSSIVKEIVFGDNQLSFNTIDGIYQKKYKHQVFTYIEQDPAIGNQTIKQYLFRCNKSVDIEFLNFLLKKFEIENISMERTIAELSGGERIKFNIIAGLVKKTPYIFMDEPSNNLDNESTKALVEVIDMMKDNHTFIIISHDPRVCFDKVNYFMVNKDSITFEKSDVSVVNKENCPLIKKSKIKIFLEYMRNKYVYMSTILIIVFLFIAAYLNNMFISKWYNNEELPLNNNIIVTYIAEGVYGELNKVYADAKNLQIQEENYYNLISFDDICKIHDYENVKKIIISDNRYIDSIAEAYFTNSLLSQLYIVSIPNEVIWDYGDIVNFGVDIRLLEEGRLPVDGAHEVVASIKLLEKYFKVDTSNKVLGQKIVIDGELYKIVGISYHDVCIVSYTDDMNRGYFKYEKGESEDIIGEIKNYLVDIDATNKNTPYNTIIYTEKNEEETVLNKLISEYSANNYYSKTYALGVKQQYNFQLVLLLAIVNIVFSTMISVIITWLFYKTMKFLQAYMQSVDYYYVSIGMTKKILILGRMWMFFFVLIGILYITWLKSDFYQMVCMYIFIDALVLFFPTLFGIYKVNRIC